MGYLKIKNVAATLVVANKKGGDKPRSYKRADTWVCPYNDIFDVIPSKARDLFFL